MCEFCTRHGEGKIWYHNMENYSREVFSRVNTDRKFRKYLRDFRKRLSFLPFAAYWFKQRVPFLYDSLVYPVVTANLKKNHFGQVVPREDVHQILEKVSTIVRLPCVCRKVFTGKEYRYCLGVGMDMREYVEGLPDFSRLEVLGPGEAVEMIDNLEDQGMVHSVWTFSTPFIGAICNCDRQCMAYNVQVKMDIARSMWKGEYLAAIDPEACVNCGQCRRYCLFQAIQEDPTLQKFQVEPLRCYGCGICRNFCKKGAISLLGRVEAMGAQAPW